MNYLLFVLVSEIVLLIGLSILPSKYWRKIYRFF